MRFAITFVCQCGELEAQAVLLAASLRRHLAGAADLVACLPTPEADWGRPARHTRRALEALGVRTLPVRNLVDDTYPIGNKIACLDPPPTDGPSPDRVVFLDSDILCMAPLDPGSHFTGDFCVKPADFSTFAGADEHWSRLYRLFGLPDPDVRVIATVSAEEMWPYFNAGVVGVWADAGLAPTWAECCRRIDAETWVPSRRPHLDQIALPIAAALCGLKLTLLDEALNFPAHLRPLRRTPPVLCHYHGPGTVAREPALASEVLSIVADYPCVRPVLEAAPEWQPLLGPTRRRWWPGVPRATRCVPDAPPPAPNDIEAETLAAALERSPTPALLQTLVDISRRRFGWFTRHPSRAFEYPWVIGRAMRLRTGHVVDVGAGVSPVPLLMALRGLQVTTIDGAAAVRDPAAGTSDWNEWGFLDYSALDPAIRSINGDAAAVDLPAGCCEAVYSISVVEHMPAATRRRLWPRLSDWLVPGGHLVLTVNLAPNTETLWNRSAGREVEPADRHGDLAELVAELTRLGFDLDERADLRGVPGLRADVAMLDLVKARTPGETHR